jgi:hypothetical protein
MKNLKSFTASRHGEDSRRVFSVDFPHRLTFVVEVEHLEAMAIVPSGKFDRINEANIRTRYKEEKQTAGAKRSREVFFGLLTKLDFATSKWEKFSIHIPSPALFF